MSLSTMTVKVLERYLGGSEDRHVRCGLAVGRGGGSGVSGCLSLGKVERGPTTVH